MIYIADLKTMKGQATMENTPLIYTERLVLRKFNEQDVAALFSILKDAEVNQFLPMFPLKTLDEAQSFLQKQYLSTYQKPQGFRYAVCLKTDQIPIGYLNISDNGSFDMGYGLAKKYWNQGIITEAGAAAVKTFKKAGLPFLTATHDIKNPASGAVMKKIGMTYQYSYQELWQPKNRLVTFRMYQLNITAPKNYVYQKYWNQSAVHFVECL